MKQKYMAIKHITINLAETLLPSRNEVGQSLQLQTILVVVRTTILTAIHSHQMHQRGTFDLWSCFEVTCIPGAGEIRGELACPV